MKDIIEVNICKDHTWECATSILSRAGEGGTTQFQIVLTDGKMSNYLVHLDFEMPDGKTYRSDPLEVENNVAYYDIPVYLLKESGELKVQLILEKPTGEIWRSLIKRYFVLDSIYGLDEIPIIPVGKIEITDTKEHNVEQYAVAQVKDENLVPNKILVGTTILGVTGTHNCDGDFNLQEKSEIIEENGTFDIVTDPEYDAMSKAKVTVNVKPNLQEGNFTVTKNGEYEIAPEIGYEGFSKAKAKVSVKPNLQEKIASANGQITADDGYDGLSKVSVYVIPKLQDKKVKENGMVYPDSGYDGLNSVEVEVTNIPDGYLKPEGTKEITKNGDHDVAEYSRVYVKVFDSQPILQQKAVTVTENGEMIVEADRDYDGLSKVQFTVNVPTEYVAPVLQEKTVKENGTVTPDEGYDGLSKVIVDVPKDEVFLQKKSVNVTENGETIIRADSGYDGMSEILVNVDMPLQEKTITQNGEILPEEGFYGFSKVIVNVAGEVLEEWDGTIEVV